MIPRGELFNQEAAPVDRFFGCALLAAWFKREACDPELNYNRALSDFMTWIVKTAKKCV